MVVRPLVSRDVAACSRGVLGRLCASALVACAGGVLHASPRATAQDLTQQQESAGAGSAPRNASTDALAGEVTLRAARVHAWTRADGTRVYVLDRDVRARLATYDFVARAGVVMLTPEGAGVVRVRAYFEQVGASAQGVGASSFDADALPVRALLDLGQARERIDADLLVEREPELRPLRELMQRADASLSSAEAPRRTPAPAITYTPAASQAASGEPDGSAAPARRFAARANREGLGVLPQHARPGGADRATGSERQRDSRGSATPPALPAATATAPSRTAAAPAEPRAAARASGETTTGGEASASQRATPAGEESSAAARTPAPPAGEAPVTEAATPADDDGVADAVSTAPIFARTGIVTLSAASLTIQPRAAGEGAEAETAVVATGPLTLLYRDQASGQVLQATAQRAVLFVGAAKLEELASFEVERVRGVYLEGEVSISDGRYHVRGSQVYYDFAANRAVMLDAVFSTFDWSRNTTLYVRASEIRQESARQFSARDARLTNTAFFTPELSIGASSVTMTQVERPPSPTPTTTTAPTTASGGAGTGGAGGAGGDGTLLGAAVGLAGTPAGPPSTLVSARGVTLRTSDVPVFWWPFYEGDPDRPLLKDLRFENRSGSGSAIKARWDLFNLVGRRPPEGISADLQTDYYADRGAALGLRSSWDTTRHRGALFTYGVLNDEGTDVLRPGTEIEQEGEFRGLIAAEDRFEATPNWSIVSEGVYVGDETFVDAFFEEAGQSRRELTSRLRAEHTDNHAQLTLEAKGSFNDFIASEWLLQSQGYSVTKLPEVAYVRQADDLLPTAAPGVVTWFSEYRVGRYELSLDEVAARDRGFTTPFLSQRAFGIDPDQSIADALRARGLDEEPVARADTRHELVGKLSNGPVQVTPFAVVRGTFYDSEFDAFSATPGGNDQGRIWSSVGTRLATSVQRVYDAVDSRLLDIHRLRHVIEPSMTVWAAGTNVESSDIPAIDPRVDSLADGAAVRIGIAQTLHTKRGGPGRWHDAELLRWNTDVVFASDDTDPRTPVGRFFDWRPENSAFGNFVASDAAYRLTDATSLTGSVIYDLDQSQQDLTTAGILVEHRPGFTSMLEWRFHNPQDSQYVVLWGNYDLTEKYSVLIAPNYDAAEGEFQSAFVRVSRKFSSVQMSVAVNYNNITGETTFSFVLQPYGARGAAGAGFGGSGAGDFTTYSGAGGF